MKNNLILIILILGLLVIPVSAVSNTSAYDSNLQYLLHNNGTQGSHVFVDEQGHSIARFGDTYTDTYVKKLGSASAKYDGTGDYLSTAYNSAWTFGSGDFTVMWWENRTAVSAGGASIGTGTYGAISPFIFGYQEDNLIYISSNGASWDIASGKSLGGSQTGTTWDQFVVSRNGTNFYAYRNGGQTDAWTSSAAIWNDGVSNLSFGSWNDPAQVITGNQDEIAFWNVYIPIDKLYPMPYEVKTSTDIIASFSKNQTDCTDPCTVAFTDTSNGLPTAWQYSFKNVIGNNTQVIFSTLQNPVKTFTVGNYEIKLNASNSGSYNISTQNAWVNVSPQSITADFSFSPSPGFAGGSVSFTDLSSDTPTSWDWNFGDSTANVTTQNPIHTYASRGNYTVSLIVSNGYLSSSASKTIQIEGLMDHQPVVVTNPYVVVYMWQRIS